jgi:HAE1 family hydrophobic/amphiphilic exporter-1
MTSFAFVMGVLPMARATGAGAYSRNSLGIVIAFGIAVSTVLGRFVIPIYYVLGERLIDHFGQRHTTDENLPAIPPTHEHHGRLSFRLMSRWRSIRSPYP